MNSRFRVGITLGCYATAPLNLWDCPYAPAGLRYSEGSVIGPLPLRVSVSSANPALEGKILVGSLNDGMALFIPGRLFGSAE